MHAACMACCCVHECYHRLKYYVVLPVVVSVSVSGYTHCVENLKSLVITTCLLDRQISVEEAVYCSRLESEYQVSTRGDVSVCEDSWRDDVTYCSNHESFEESTRDVCVGDMCEITDVCSYTFTCTMYCSTSFLCYRSV